MSDKRIEAADDLGSTAQKIFVALGLLSSAIKSGEPWSQSCEDAKVSAFEAARKLLAELTAQRVPAQGEIALREAAVLGLEAIDTVLSSHEGQHEHAQLKTAFDALEAALSTPQTQGWRPIETAPPILCVWWSDIFRDRPPNPHIGICWWGGEWGWMPHSRKPTHWQPLPSPPHPAPVADSLVTEHQGTEK